MNFASPPRSVAKKCRIAQHGGSSFEYWKPDPHQQHPLLQAMATVLFESSPYFTSELTVVTEGRSEASSVGFSSSSSSRRSGGRDSNSSTVVV